MRVGLFRRPVMCDPPSAAVIAALAGKLAGVDGPVNDSELRSFETLFSAPQRHQARLGGLMQRHGRSPDSFQAYALRFVRLHRNRVQLVRWTFERLHRLAGADGPLHPHEDAYLARTARIWHIEYETREPQQDLGQAPPSSDDPFRTLGVSARASRSEIRAAWRQKVSSLHPDRCRNEQERARSDQRLREINAAYGKVIRFRGGRPGG